MSSYTRVKIKCWKKWWCADSKLLKYKVARQERITKKA
jgi:hypothetical protein